MSVDNELSRRDFLKLSGGTTAGFLLGGSISDILPSPEQQESALEAWAHPLYLLENSANIEGLSRNEDGTYQAINMPQIYELQADPNLDFLIARLDEMQQLTTSYLNVGREDLRIGAQPIDWEGKTYLVPTVYTPEGSLVVQDPRPAGERSLIQLLTPGENSKLYVFPTYSDRADTNAGVFVKVTTERVNGGTHSVQSIVGRDSDGSYREIYDFEGVVNSPSLTIRNEQGQSLGMLSRGERVGIVSDPDKPVKVPGKTEDFVQIATLEPKEGVSAGFSAIGASFMNLEDVFEAVPQEELVALSMPEIVEPELPYEHELIRSLATFERAQIQSPDQRYTAYLSKDYLSEELGISDIVVSPSTAQNVSGAVLSEIYRYANFQIDRMKSQRGSELKNVEPGDEIRLEIVFFDNVRRTTNQIQAITGSTELTGKLTHIVQYIVSDEEFKSIEESFADKRKSGDVPEYLPLNTQYWNSTYKQGLAFFDEQGRLVIVNKKYPRYKGSENYSTTARFYSDSAPAAMSALSAMLAEGEAGSSPSNGIDWHTMVVGRAMGCTEQNNYCTYLDSPLIQFSR